MEADFLTSSSVPATGTIAVPATGTIAVLATGTSLELADLVDKSILEWLGDAEGVPAGPAVVGPITRSQSSQPPRVLGQSRFGNQVTGTEKLAEASKSFVPKKAKEKTQWAVRNFNSWRQWHSQQVPNEPVPEDLLESNDPTLLNKWLSLYVLETRRMDGKRFPSTSLDCLLAGLLRHMREKNPLASNFLDDNDPHYAGLRGTRDTVARQLRTDGVGACVKHAEVLSKEEEQLLWDSGVMGVDNPRALANAVFFANGKNLCLRGSREQYQLKLSQFRFEDDYVEYTENGKIVQEAIKISVTTKLSGIMQIHP